MEPLILTVSMPNFNHASYLPTRIPSILEAMPQNSELIIIDDGSTDESVSIIEKFQKKDPRIVFIKKEKNQGVISVLQEILFLARGKFISFQSSDDGIFPHFFSRMLDFASQYPGYAVYTSNFGYSNEKLPSKEEEVKYNLLIQNFKQIGLFSKEQIVQVFSKKELWIPGHASILKRELLLSLGGFIPSLEQHADWFLIHSAALIGGVAYLPETLAIWRIAADSYSFAESAKKQKHFQIQLNFFNLLKQKDMKELRIRFRKSALLRGVIREYFMYFCIHPRYWDFLFFFVTRVLKKRIQNFFKNKALRFKKNGSMS